MVVSIPVTKGTGATVNTTVEESKQPFAAVTTTVKLPA